MNLKNKKLLASKVLGVGKERVYMNENNLKQIEEAITRQDILDLVESGAIIIKEVKGRRKVIKRKHKRGRGKIKKSVDKSKTAYVLLTRKLRKHTSVLRRRGMIDSERYTKIRKAIKASRFKSKRHLVESGMEI